MIFTIEILTCRLKMLISRPMIPFKSVKVKKANLNNPIKYRVISLINTNQALSEALVRIYLAQNNLPAPIPTTISREIKKQLGI